jgi:hypothetical protein
VPRGTLAVVAAALYAAAASSTAPLTTAAAVAVAVPATAVLVLVIRRRPGPWSQAARPDPLPPGPRLRRTAAAWAVLVVLGATGEFAAWLRQPAYDVASPDHPTLSLLLDPVTGGGPGRFAAWCAWLYAGWRVARR